MSRPRARWIVLTPSADDAGWRAAIGEAAAAAGLTLIDARLPGGDPADPHCVFITEDADVAVAAQPSALVAIVPEPETAPEAIAEVYDLQRPADRWHASLLLARATGLSEDHSVVTASDLARKPSLIRLFGDMEVVPPRSIAEASRRPAVAGAFAMYRNRYLADSSPIPWSEKLFAYDERASRDWPEWGVMDTTGRPRILVWGPYVALPPGLWRAVIRFVVDDTAAGRQFRFDWGTQAACASEYVTPGRPGTYEITLDWLFEKAEAAEMRLILMEGSFMGTVMFQGVTVQRIPSQATAEQHAA